MASQTETGHFKNLANIKLFKDFLVQLGVIYNPSNTLLKIPAITTLITQCQTDYDGWVNKLTAYKNKTDLREIAFEPIAKLVTSINASVQQLNEPQQTFNDIQAIVSKIHGSDNRIKSSEASKLIDPNTPTPVTDQEVLPTDPISTAQLSYDSLVKNFDLLIKRLQTITTYAPNETELKIVTLQAQYTNLNLVNTDAGNATNALFIARNQRNLTFYSTQTGLYDITLKIKKYLKSNKATLPAYSQATKFKFVKIVQKKKKKKS